MTITAIGSGIGHLLWAVAYILIIRRARLDKLHGMPAAALCANLAWEFSFALVFPSHPLVLRAVYFGWLVMDLVIAWQYLQYGRAVFTPRLPPGWFLPSFAAGLLVALVFTITYTVQFDDQGLVAAFIGNTLMSGLFIDMLLRRGSVRGQSLAIAVCKMLATALVALNAVARTPDAPFLYSLCAISFLFDLIYSAGVYAQTRRDGLNPLHHW